MMNWGDLKSLAQGFIHRKDMDWDALQPLACDEISIRLKVMENEGVGQVAMTGGAVNGGMLQRGDLPADYAAMRAVQRSKTVYKPSSIKAMLQNRPGAFYAVSGRQLIMSGTEPVTIVYSMRTQPAGDDGDTNEVLSFYSNVYLYAVVKQAAIFAQDFDAAGEYETQLDGAIGTANDTYMDAAYGPDAQPIVPGGTI